MVAAVKFNAVTEHLAEGRIKLQTDVFKIFLTPTLPDTATPALYADISSTELAAVDGYVTGGITVTIASSAQAGGVYSATITNVVNALQAVAGPIGPYRYLVLYSATTGALMQYWDLGAPVTLLESDFLSLSFPDSFVVRIT